MSKELRLEIDPSIVLLAPLDDASPEEKLAYQLLVFDNTRRQMPWIAGRGLEDLLVASLSYFRTRRRELDILLDIYTHGAYGVLEVDKFKYFDVHQIHVDPKYIEGLKRIKECLG